MVAMVQVFSQSRQRQNDVGVMTFASVSMILLLQKGQLAGRWAVSVDRASYMIRSPRSVGRLSRQLVHHHARCPRGLFTTAHAAT
jgi:hypothetical protein